MPWKKISFEKDLERLKLFGLPKSYAGLKEAFQELIDKRINDDSVFKEKTIKIKQGFSSGKLKKTDADVLFFKALDESIKKERQKFS